MFHIKIKNKSLSIPSNPSKGPYTTEQSPSRLAVERKGPKKTCPKKIIFFYRRSSLFLFSYFPSIGLLLRDTAAQISARGRERRSAVHTSGRARLQLGGLSL